MSLKMCLCLPKEAKGLRVGNKGPFSLHSEDESDFHFQEILSEIIHMSVGEGWEVTVH